MLANHLNEQGFRSSTSGSRVRTGMKGIEIEIRSSEDPRQASDRSPATLVWVDVSGAVKDSMKFDVGGWGLTPGDQAIDLAHGVLESLLPPIAWLAGLPADRQRIVKVQHASRMWEACVGLPWITVGLQADESGGRSIGRRIRADFDAPQAIVDRVANVFPLIDQLPAARQGSPHWLKLFLSMTPAGPGGRIDLDNQLSWDAPEVSRRLHWPSTQAIQFVRQLLVFRPITPIAAKRPSWVHRLVTRESRGAD